MTSTSSQMQRLVGRLRDMARTAGKYDVGDYWNACDEAADEIERLLCDARRYRWIRDGGWLLIGEDREWPTAETVDALVDSAISDALGVTTNPEHTGER